SVTLPYTIKEEDNGRILHLMGTGNLTVPTGLSYGFECGFRKTTVSSNLVNFVGVPGITLNRPSGKLAQLGVQWGSCYLECNHEYVSGTIPVASNNFILSGDLENA